MRCNRKTSGLAVTPLRKQRFHLNYYQDFAATPQSEIPKRKLLNVNDFNLQTVDNQLFANS